MDARDLSWETKTSGNTLMQQIEAMAKELSVPQAHRRDLRWMVENLRSHALTRKDKNYCEHKVLLNYVQMALQQGINSLGE